MNETASALLSIVVLAAFGLLIFGVRFVWIGPHRTQGLMMVTVALILVVNVLIWSI